MSEPATLDQVIATDAWTSQSESQPTETETPAPEPVATTPEVAADAARARDEDGKFTSTEKAAEKPGKRRNNPYEAVKEATGETARERDLRIAAEKRASELEAQLAEARRQPAPREVERPAPSAQTAEPTRPKPLPDQIGTTYATWEDYNEDLIDWKQEQREANSDLHAKIAAALEAERVHQRERQRITDLRERAVAKYPDYEAKVGASQVPFRNMAIMNEALNRMPEPEHVIYALASDHALAERIAQIDNLFDLAVELTKIVSPSSGVAVRPDSTSTARPSNAKPPINRVGGTASAVAIDPEDLEFGPEYIRAANAQDKKRREAGRW